MQTLLDAIYLVGLGVISILVAAPLLKHGPRWYRNALDWWGRTTRARAERRAVKLEREIAHYEWAIVHDAVVRRGMVKIANGVLYMLAFIVVLTTISAIEARVAPWAVVKVLHEAGQTIDVPEDMKSLMLVTKYVTKILLPISTVIFFRGFFMILSGIRYLAVELRMRDLKESLEKMQKRILLS
jgi:hypothetical protein